MGLKNLDTFSNLSHYDQQLSHFVSNRFGGYSKGKYESLNLSDNVGDDPGAVIKNREIVRKTLGTKSLSFTKQEHGDEVVIRTIENSENIFEADAQITNVPGIGLAALIADCVPILLFDPVQKSIAAIHSGWKSTALNIGGKTVRKMGADLGSNPKNIKAAIGPGICKNSFETGLEVFDKLKNFVPKNIKFTSPHKQAGKVYIDLHLVVKYQLIEVGILESSIETMAIDTYSNKQYFSARRMGFESGRQAACIGMIN
jgi:YfiH family protein